MPESDEKKLQAALKDKSIFRQLATVIRAYDTDSTIYAKNCDDIASWVPVGGTVPIYEGTDDFMQNAVDVHKLANIVKLDEDFVHDAHFDIKGYLTDRLARNFAFAEEDAFVNGTGTDMPTGIIHPDTGAAIAVTVSTITADDVIRLFFSLDREYRQNAVWMMNDATALALRQLKDSAGNYIWRSTDDTIFGKRVVISNYMPSAEAGLVPVIFGDMSYYWIVERKPLSVRPLIEKFATHGQIGYLSYEFLDAKLVRREAVKGIRIGTAG